MASSKRERELARMRAERQAARRAAAEAARKARQRTLALSLAVLAVAGIAVGAFFATQGDDKKSSTLAQPTPTVSAAPTSTVKPTATVAPVAGAATCAYNATTEPAAKKIDGTPPTANVAKAAKKVTLTTDQGIIALSLNGAKAPCTTNSFAFLTGQKYFDGTTCHRLTTSGIFVLQCGDPSGTGSGGPGYQFAEENLKGATYPRGTIAMARTQTPGSNGSQFFLVYKDSPLPADYTPFGTITAGLDVLDKVAKAGSTPDGDGKPKLSVTIKTAVLA